MAISEHGRQSKPHRSTAPTETAAARLFRRAREESVRSRPSRLTTRLALPDRTVTAIPIGGRGSIRRRPEDGQPQRVGALARAARRCHTWHILGRISTLTVRSSLATRPSGRAKSRGPLRASRLAVDELDLVRPAEAPGIRPGASREALRAMPRPRRSRAGRAGGRGSGGSDEPGSAWPCAAARGRLPVRWSEAACRPRAARAPNGRRADRPFDDVERKPARVFMGGHLDRRGSSRPRTVCTSSKRSPTLSGPCRRRRTATVDDCHSASVCGSVRNAKTSGGCRVICLSYSMCNGAPFR
jgi:hypothetical protein